MSFIGTIIRSYVEGQAAKASLEEIRKELESNRDEVSERMAAAADTPGNCAQAGHVIGIERWGTERLRSALSANPCPKDDEYDAYRPQCAQNMAALSQEFLAARADTLALFEGLRAVPDRRIPHNDLGDLSVRGWLVYLSNHASMESKKLKVNRIPQKNK